MFPPAGPCTKASSMLGLPACDWVPRLEDMENPFVGVASGVSRRAGIYGGSGWFSGLRSEIQFLCGKYSWNFDELGS